MQLELFSATKHLEKYLSFYLYLVFSSYDCFFPSHPGLYCCDRAEATHCQVACRRILRSMSTEHEIMDGLIQECGSQPLPQEPMWQCFLGSAHPPSPPEEETPHPVKVDSAKLHCCSKANTSLCRCSNHILVEANPKIPYDYSLPKNKT